MVNPGNRAELSGDSPVLVIREVDARLNIVFSIAGNNILTENYYPDIEGIVRIRNLSKLATLYMDQPLSRDPNRIIGNPITVDLVLADNSNTFNSTITIYPCDVLTYGTLSLDNILFMPLSRSVGRITYPGQREILGFYGRDGGRTINAGIGYIFESKMRFVRIPVITLYSGFTSFDVSLSKMVELVGNSGDGHIISQSDIRFYDIYDVMSFHFDVKPFPPVGRTTFLFRNCFHALETFTCTGDVESQRKWTRSTASVDNESIVVENELTNTRTVYTGYITEQMCGVLEDLLNSDDICLLTPSGRIPVIISGESYKVLNRPDEVISASFEYKIANNNQGEFFFSSQQAGIGRIFDSTFNETFN